MKRSRAVPLVLMSGAAGMAGCDGADQAARDAPPAPTFPTEAACLDTGVFAAKACADLVVQEGREAPPAQAMNYASVDECRADDYFQDDYCVAKYEEALQLSQDYAPSYDNVAACEADYGPQGCGRQTVQGGGGGYWSPFFTGFLVSSAINGIFAQPQPYYRDYYGGGYRTLGGYGFDGRGRGTYVPQQAYRQTQTVTTGRTNAVKARTGQLRATPTRANAQRTSVARRGGFGGRSGGRGYGG
ncbi:DUF1190 domain-containing protein [Parvularcula dongshanensis]|uniref:Uncharacterized protein YgiB involved in biofilm formation n=1 Tax=Parvularcula dongshanensis TaxID=1173995 RepID=A0A840I6K6_9PROT|nr:DUF1190 domain-containing protein [Parvularcula dongshanensis]MBB4659758.1 uncharacterized protein YgiB involved in biofilm formation [Parvularcula dongshanensis]